jgi:hypothetical protein
MTGSTPPDLPATVSPVKRPRRSTRSLPGSIRRLIERGEARAPQRDLADVLSEIGRPPGPVTDAGTRALAEQRGERG